MSLGVFLGLVAAVCGILLLTGMDTGKLDQWEVTGIGLIAAGLGLVFGGYVIPIFTRKG